MVESEKIKEENERLCEENRMFQHQSEKLSSTLSSTKFWLGSTLVSLLVTGAGFWYLTREIRRVKVDILKSLQEIKMGELKAKPTYFPNYVE